MSACIVGWAHTPFGKLEGEDIESLMSAVTAGAIADAGIEASDIDEIFVEDSALRRKMADVLKRHMTVDDELDAEVRRRIKNLEEGTSTWDVEYQKALEQIIRNRGLE